MELTYNQKQKYSVTISVLLEKTISVEAESREAAERVAKQKFFFNEVVLSPENDYKQSNYTVSNPISKNIEEEIEHDDISI